ncbi:MAG: GlsB/YeaQ/YmgE family stress response membrane protein [Steroidobacteraceae bacterium]
MNILIWLVIGGLLGWVASMFMGTNGRQGIILNVVVGIVGAVVGGWLLSGVFGSSTINQGNFSMSGLFVSLLGAIVLLAIVKLLGGIARQS